MAQSLSSLQKSEFLNLDILIFHVEKLNVEVHKPTPHFQNKISVCRLTGRLCSLQKLKLQTQKCKNQVQINRGYDLEISRSV